MAGGDVAGLVAQHPGELGLVVGQRQQAARDVDIAARQGEGVDHVAVEQGEGEGLVGQFGRVLDPVADLRDIGLQRLVLVASAELGHRLRIFLASQLLLVLGRQRGVLQLAGRGIAHLGAAERSQQRQDEQQADEPSSHGSTSIWAGWVTSIIGPAASNK